MLAREYKQHYIYKIVDHIMIMTDPSLDLQRSAALANTKTNTYAYTLTCTHASNGGMMQGVI